jgi:hypothetical protein
MRHARTRPGAGTVRATELAAADGRREARRLGAETVGTFLLVMVHLVGPPLGALVGTAVMTLLHPATGAGERAAAEGRPA